MAGRNHIPPKASKLRDVHYDPRLLHHLHYRSAVAAPPPPARSHLLEDRIAIQHREIQNLLVDNQRLAATHVALKQELALAQQEFRQLSAAAAEVKAERDGEVRDVYEKSLKMDDKVREVNAMSAELDQVRADVQRLSVVKQEFAAQLQKINGDLEKARKNAQRVPVIKAEIEAVNKEIQRGRAAVECEKKNRDSNNEHAKVMEKNMVALAREIERLHAELPNAESKARAAAVAAAVANPSAGYAANYGDHEMAYGGAPYPDPYGMHQVQGGADADSRYESGAMSRAPYDIKQTHVHM